MICIDGHCDWTNSCHSISQSLLISFGYKSVVCDMSNCKSAVVVTRLSILLGETQSWMLTAVWRQTIYTWRQSQVIYHWGIWVGVWRLQPIADHIVIGIGHPGTTAAIGSIWLGAVHQVLLAQRYKLTCLLVNLSLNGSRGAEGPTWATETLWGTCKTL